MREYHVHFSFYSEEYGNFDDTSYRLIAENPFEAREKAWQMCDEDSDTLFRSNIRQFAVTWTPNMLDAGDYFYSHAADIKLNLGRLLNVAIPNDRIRGGESKNRLEAERCSDLSALRTLDAVAKDLYADKGIIPPSIYEELYYAEKLCEHLGWGEKADALWERTDRAKKWDAGSIYSIRDLFKDGYTTLCGETELFNEHFGRNGIYPVHNKPDERDYTYIRRWQDKWTIDSLRRLPFYKETDVITNSAAHMSYEWQTLLLNCDLLNDGYRKPENQLWQPVDPSEHNEDIKDGMIIVENLITGQRMTCDKGNFSGVLRPDVYAALDFNALKRDYAAVLGENSVSVRSGSFSNAGLDDGEDEFER